MIKKIFFLFIFLVCEFQAFCETPLAEQLRQNGYLEICDKNHGTKIYNSLYAKFDIFIEFLQKNPIWTKKLYTAKERFIRSKDKNYYSTDFFGFYDESKIEKRGQISFYYSTHFYEFICLHYKEFKQIPEISNFFEICLEIQKPYENLFNEIANEIGLKHIFSCKLGHVPVLFKVIKYFPNYIAARPHYDGTAFSLFLDSTDNQSLVLSAYKPTFRVDDFFTPARKFSRDSNQNSILLIAGGHLAEFSIYPTPHIVLQSGKTRYATIAFAMRPNYKIQKNQFANLPNFKY